MGADKYWKNRAFGRLLTALGGFPVTRGTADREALKRCIAVLEGGEPLVLFPEGERKSGPIVQPLFDGAAYVAVEGRRPDRSRRDRRLGARHAEGCEVHPPAEAARGDRRADVGAEDLESPRPSGTRRAQLSPSTSRPSCNGCSTSRRRGSSDRLRRSARVRGGDPWPTRWDLDAAQLARRVHRQLRHADVDRFDAEPGCGDRPDGGAARHVVATDEDLRRHSRLVEDALQHGGRARRRGVALVAVELDRRTAVDDRLMIGVVALA